MRLDILPYVYLLPDNVFRYNVYHCYTGDRHLEFYRIHEKYGKFTPSQHIFLPSFHTGGIVRFGPNRVSFNSASSLKSIYGTKANTRKSDLYGCFPNFFNSFSTQTIVDEKAYHHAEKRKAVSSALHGDTAQNIEEAIFNNLETLCEILGDRPYNGGEIGRESWQEVNVSDVMAHFSFDVMGEVCFGKNMGMQRQPEKRYIIPILSEGARGLNTVSHLALFLPPF